MKVFLKNPLFFAFVFPATVDATLTLVGQNSMYWSAQKVNEASPAYYALQFSPWLFVIGSLSWLGFWYWAIKRLREPFNFFFVFLFIAGHSWGSGSWLWKLARERGLYSATDQASVMLVWGVVIFYFALTAVFASVSLKNYFQNKRKF